MIASEKKDDQTLAAHLSSGLAVSFHSGKIIFYNSVTQKTKQLFTIPAEKLIVQLVLIVTFPIRVFALKVYWN